MKTVLITGVAGFLGRHTAARFAREGWRVVGIDDVAPENAPGDRCALYVRMSLPQPELGDLLREEQPETLVHCAGRASVPLSMQDPAGDYFANGVLTFEILEALRREAKGCRMIYLSSAAVYGNPERLPVREVDPVLPLSPYGYHKRIGELVCEEYSRIYGIPATVVRIFSAYGPGLRRQVVWDIFRRLLSGEKLRLHGTGKESRDFVHAADVSRGLELFAREKDKGYAVYNLGSGRETSIAELAQIAARVMEADCAVEFDGEAALGQPVNWRADIGRACEVGYEARVTIEEGVRSLAAWVQAEQGVV
jgi:UDP-glucose 4-epimerase